MRIGLGSDHRGLALKASLARFLAARGHAVVDFGPATADSCDYPDFAAAVGRAVARGRVGRGILICATGIGMTIAANKVPKVRAALCLSELMAERAAAHNRANVLVLGADLVTPARARRVVTRWLATPFAGGRHARRLAKIGNLERGQSTSRTRRS